MATFPFHKQLDVMDCGPTCLRMIAKYYGRNISLPKLRELCDINKEGVSLLGISDAAEKIGFRTLAAKVTIEQLHKAVVPCIMHWGQEHFVILYKVSSNKYYIADPAKGLILYRKQELERKFIGDKKKEGIVLFLQTTPEFFHYENDEENIIKNI